MVAEHVRILFWADSFWPSIGGLETWAARYVISLRDRGFDVTVVTTHAGFETADHNTFRGIPVHRLPLWPALKSEEPRQILLARQSVARLRQSVKPHCVHVNTCGPTSAFYLWTRHVAPAPTVFTLHGMWLEAYAAPGSLLAQALECSDRVVAVSRATSDWALKFAAHLAPRMQVIHPAMDPLPGPPAPVSRPRTLLCAGRISREKGFDLAIEAFARVYPGFNDARLVIAGDGAEKPALERLASNLGIANAVTFTGWINPSDLPALMTQAGIVVTPSRQEGFGLTPLEAAHAARPTVGFAVGGLPEVVIHGRTGLLAPPEDVNALSRHMAALLENPARAQSLGLAAREWARATFHWSAHMDQYEQVLMNLLTGARTDGNPASSCA